MLTDIVKEILEIIVQLDANAMAKKRGEWFAFLNQMIC